MFLKSNSTRNSSNAIRSTTWLFAKGPTYSLRLRLMLWYGGLMALGLSCFGLLVLVIVSGTVNENARTEIQGDTQIAQSTLHRILGAQPPYWPVLSALDELNIYHTSDTIVNVFNPSGKLIYSSDHLASLSLDSETIPELQSTSDGVWSNTSVNGEQALSESTAIYLSSHTAAGSSTGRSIIGILVVTRTLREVNSTLILLQRLLLTTGSIMMILVVGLGWIILSYALRPLSDLVKATHSITSSMAYNKRATDLSQRVKQPEGENEMAQVVGAFNEMLTSIEESTMVQRRFIADASHELRAPLTTIQGNLAFLIRHVNSIPPAERHTMLADAHGETLRLATLVEELLLLARADANMEPSINPTQPAPLVELDRTLLRLVRQMRRRLEVDESTISAIKIEIGGIEPVRVHGDEEVMRRIMVILLDNAIKYTHSDEGGGEERITVALERAGKEAVMRVSDTGIGIEEKDLPHIFERFYRADRARSRVGTGLGLAIAQMLVEQLDGRITAESKPGQGTTFRVWLPLADANP